MSRIFTVSVASVYPHYVAKVEKKGRTKEELHTVIHWLTGYTEKGLQKVIADKTDFGNSILRPIHYPPITADNREKPIRNQPIHSSGRPIRRMKRTSP